MRIAFALSMSILPILLYACGNEEVTSPAAGGGGSLASSGGAGRAGGGSSESGGTGGVSGGAASTGGTGVIAGGSGSSTGGAQPTAGGTSPSGSGGASSSGGSGSSTGSVSGSGGGLATGGAAGSSTGGVLPSAGGTSPNGSGGAPSSGGSGSNTGGVVAAAGGPAGGGSAGSSSGGSAAGGSGGSGTPTAGAGNTGPCPPPVTPVDVSEPTTVVGTGAGTCTEAALDAALAEGGIIAFSCGTGPTTLTLSGPKTIAKNTVIDGGNLITISGGQAHRIFVTQGDIDFTLQNVTLADALVNGARGDGPSQANSGAAVYRQSSGRLTVIHSVFNHNHATDAGADIGGGAIYSYGGDTVITDSTFEGNSGASGGAIGNLRSNLTIVNSVFTGNTARDQMGGAIALDGQNMDHGKVFTLCGVVVKNNQARLEGGGVYRYGYPDESTVIDYSTFDGNAATDQGQTSGGGLGGGLYVHTDTANAMPLTITNSTISNNSAGYGAGGLFLYNVPVTMTNVTIANNTAVTSLGGGLSAGTATGTLKNCTIAGNHADDAGSFGGAIIGGDGLTLINTIIANNTAGNAWNPVSCTDLSAGGDHDLQYPTQRASGQDDNPCVTGITFADPMLGPLADNGGPTQTMALLAGSPAIAAGTSCPETDQRGKSRTISCDIGAYQRDGL